MKTVTVIIPTLNAEEQVSNLLNSLKQQSFPPREIIVIDSESSDKTLELAKNQGAKVISINRKDFDHGGSRNLAAQKAEGEYILFLTQDAYPYDNTTIEHLISAFEEEEGIVAVYGRQIAYPNSSEREKLIRQFNYPAESKTKSSKEIELLGIKSYFFSDVCAMYDKVHFFKLNGFETPIATNEDMLMAARIIADGKKIRYVADAKVYHSHDSKLREIFSRNYLIGQFLAKYKTDFTNGNANREGLKMVKQVSKQLVGKGLIGECCMFWVECFVKLLGNYLGKKAYNSTSK